MRKYFYIVGLIGVNWFSASALDKMFADTDIVLSAVNSRGSVRSVSLFKDSVLALNIDGGFYLAEVDSVSKDLKNVRHTSIFSSLGIEGRFTYDEESGTLYFSKGGMLYEAKVDGGVVGTPKPLEIKDVTFSERETREGGMFSHASTRYKKKLQGGLQNPILAENGKRLFFAADFTQGNGGLDIWTITRQKNGKWTAPRSAGQRINSKHDEDLPFVFNDKIVYSSYDKKGDFDLWVSKQRSTEKPQHLPEKFNSQQKERNMVVLKNALFFLRDNKLYRLENKIEKKVEPSETPVVSSDDVVTLADRQIVYFKYNSDESDSTFAKKVGLIKRYIEENPNCRFKIVGHTDERGNVKENKALSIRRASKIYDELIKLKVPQSLLEKDGLGASQPAVKNAKSDEEHQKNRRVEIIKMEGVR